MITPINSGRLQSDMDCAGFSLLNFTGGATGGMYAVNIKSSPYNAHGDGVNDDTAAIQSAVNDMTALGGGRIYFPAGTYLVGGALQDTSGRNAQILLPVIPTSSAPVTIELVGALAPPTQFFQDTVLPDPRAFSIIKSTLTGASGSAAFIAGAESPGNYWDNVQLVVRDLVFQAPPNPTFTAFNCFNTMGPQFHRVLIHTGNLQGLHVTEPTHSNAVAIKLAPSNHSGGQIVNNVHIWGFYSGLQDGELAENHVTVWSCKQAVLVPFTYHLSTYSMLGVFACPRGIVAAGVGYSGNPGDDGTHYMRVYAFAGERGTAASGTAQAWQERVYDIDDASNLLKGDLKWLNILAGTGNDHSFVKNSATNLLTSELGT